jgi:Zn-dependent peptidase ImmA (M78 family)
MDNDMRELIGLLGKAIVPPGKRKTVGHELAHAVLLSEQIQESCINIKK